MFCKPNCHFIGSKTDSSTVETASVLSSSGSKLQVSVVDKYINQTTVHKHLCVILIFHNPSMAIIQDNNDAVLILEGWRYNLFFECNYGSYIIKLLCSW